LGEVLFGRIVAERKRFFRRRRYFSGPSKKRNNLTGQDGSRRA
jgi:hypothetical protein